jgi:hypothetical protein
VARKHWGASMLALVFALGVGAVLFVPASGRAAQITFGFEATITSVDDPSNVFGGAFAVGETISGSYTFDSSLNDAIPADSTVGFYGIKTTSPSYSSGSGGIVDPIVLQAGTDALGIDPGSAIDNYVAVFDDTSDGYNAILTTTSWSVNGADQTDEIRFLLQLGGAPPDTLPSEALPLAPPPLSAFTNRRLGILVPTGPGQFASAEATVFQLVPEPASGLLVALGLGALAVRRRRP